MPGAINDTVSTRRNVLIPEQIYSLMVASGFDGKTAHTYPDGTVATPAAMATAIALAESGGRVDAVGQNAPGYGSDYGLVQINDTAHPDVSQAQAFDPSFAAQWMFKNSANGTNFGAWSAYSGHKDANGNSPYVAHLADANRAQASYNGSTPWWLAIASPGSALLGGAAGNLGGIVSTVESGITAPFRAVMSTGQFLSKLADPKTWVRVLQVVGGVALIGGGLFYLMEPDARAAAVDSVKAAMVA